VSVSVVDTSAWIDFLRGDAKAVARVDPLLSDGVIAVTGPIRAEVLSGSTSSMQYEQLRQLFDGLVGIPDPPAMWERVAEYRFALARGGFQADIVDLAIAVTAFASGLRLLTRDRDFERIRTVVPIELDLF
jgi:predicted nucleic acid-binding protein